MRNLPAQLLRKPQWVQFGVLAGAGAVTGWGHAPLDLWFVSVFVLGLLFALCGHVTTARQSAFVLWSFGFGYFAFSLRWIVEPFLVDIARHGWMAPFALIMMGAGAAVFWALAGWLAARIAPRSGIMVALLVVAAEVLRSLILTGFPWALLGHVWIGGHLAQLAAWGGPHILSLLTVFAALMITAFVQKRIAIGLVGWAVIATLAIAVRPDPPAPVTAGLPIVRLVQPNAPQDQKWDPAMRDVFLNRMIAFSSEGEVPDLVVWPETSVPYLLGQVQENLSFLTDAARGAPLVFGIQRRDASGGAYNSLVVADGAGQVHRLYDKRHLVPFGEYIPGARLLGRFGLQGLAGNLGVGFTPGTRDNVVDLPGIGAAVALICYEGIFAEEITYGVRPRVLLLITNDAWFGKAAGPRQHFAQARLRAIEHGLPMIRVANTGISAVFDGQGWNRGSIPLGQAGFIDAPLPAALPATLYSRTGDWPVFVILVLLTLGAYVRLRRDGD